MIAEFPEWSRFTTQHAAEYEAAIAKFPPYGDLLLNGLLVWLDYFDNLQVSRIGQNIVIRFTEVFSKENNQVLTLVGRHKVDETFSKLFEWQIQHKMPQVLHMVPGATIEHLAHPENYDIEQDLDNSDYVLSANLLTNFQGNKMRQFRRKVVKFRDLHAKDLKVIELQLAKYENKRLLINSTHLWNHVYTRNDRTHIEGLAIDKALQFAEVLNLRCLTVFIGGKLEGYSLFRVLAQPKWITIPHIKVSNHQEYAFDFLTYETARLAVHEGIDYINFEQDLGLPGLRQHKLMLRPIGQLFKYTVKPKTN